MTARAVSVVIPSRNGAARLPETLASLAGQVGPDGFEVVVVDDGSNDATSDLAARAVIAGAATRVVRHATSRGRAAACNSGVEAARGEVVILLDDDMTARAGLVEAHRAFHAPSPRAAARGKVVLGPVERDSCFARFLRREEAFEAQRLGARPDDLPFPLSQTGHFSIRRSVFLDAGGFDASITLYGFEDIELGYRLARRDVRLVFLPTAESVHRAYMTNLERYLDRHWEAGSVARQLALRHPEGEFRQYLRVDPPGATADGDVPLGLKALRASNRLLLRRGIRRLAGSRAGFGALKAALSAGEALRADRLVHFGYHVARDIRYFEGYFGEREPRGRCASG